MNSAMTMTALENGLNVSLDSKKTAKLGREKVINIKGKFQSYMQNLKKQETVSNVAPVSIPKDNTSNYKRILDTFKLVILNNGPEVVRQTGARKLKVNPIVRDSSKKMYDSCIKDGVAIKETVTVEISKPVNEPVNASVNNIAPFSKVQNMEPVHETPMPSRAQESVREFSMPAPASQPVVNNEPNLSNFSRVMRMDYNTNAMTSPSVEKTVEEKIQRDSSVSIDDYLQHGSNSSDKDIAELLQTNEKLDSEIGRSQSVLENLEAELKRIQEIREEKRKAKLNALEEERLSKTATLNGLTEQIRALQEAIRQEQQNLNEPSSYRR